MKPNFFRDKWRKPKGIQSKVRLSKRGNIKLIRKGRSKGKIRKIKLVHNIQELKNEKQVIIAKIGRKKKIELLKEAEKLGIKLVNIKDPKEFLKKIEEKMNKRKAKKKEEGKKKEEKEEKKKEKSKEKLEEKITKEKEEENKEKKEEIKK